MALVKVKETGKLVQFADKHAEQIAKDYPSEYELVAPVRIKLEEIKPIEKKNEVIAPVATDEVELVFKYEKQTEEKPIEPIKEAEPTETKTDKPRRGRKPKS